MSNEIIIRSVYGKVNQTYFVQPCPNPKTRRLPECVKPVDSNGDMILSEQDVADLSKGLKHFIPANAVFEITDGTRFDLDDIVDNATWEAIKHCNWIAKDRFETNEHGELVIDGGAKRYGVADLYVERPGEITKARITKKQLVHKANTYIYEDSHDARVKKCKVLGRNLDRAPEPDVLDYLLDKSEKNPREVIKLYEGEEWRMQLFIMDAVERGVIRKADGIYKYDDKMLGGSMNATVSLLSDIRYKKILESIKRETYPEYKTADEIKEDTEEMLNSVKEATSKSKAKNNK